MALTPEQTAQLADLQNQSASIEGQMGPVNSAINTSKRIGIARCDGE